MVQPILASTLLHLDRAGQNRAEERHLPSNFVDIDDVFHGGFKRGRITCISGERRTGKTLVRMSDQICTSADSGKAFSDEIAQNISHTLTFIHHKSIFLQYFFPRSRSIYSSRVLFLVKHPKPPSLTQQAHLTFFVSTRSSLHMSRPNKLSNARLRPAMSIPGYLVRAVLPMTSILSPTNLSIVSKLCASSTSLASAKRSTKYARTCAVTIRIHI